LPVGALWLDSGRKEWRRGIETAREGKGRKAKEREKKFRGNGI